MVHRALIGNAEFLEHRVLFAGENLVNASDLDPSFGDGGRATIDFGGTLAVQDMLALPGRQTLVLTTDLLRLNADGSPDLTFGPNGMRDVPGEERATAMSFAPDGGLLLVGSTTDGAVQTFGGDEDWLIRKLKPDGALDESFGIGGRVRLDIATRDDLALSVLPQPDGRIMVVGYEQQQFLSRVKQTPRIVVARFEANGAVDTTFGTNGVVSAGVPGFEANRAVAGLLQPDGKIVVVGNSQRREAGFDPFIATPAQVALFRFNVDGSLDNSFGGGDGIVVNRPSSARDAALDASGGILVAGSQSGGAQNAFAVTRFRTTGSLDRSFGRGGIAGIAFPKESDFRSAEHLAIQPSGHIVLSGMVSLNHTALARFSPAGDVDTDFGTAGAIFTEYNSGTPATHVLANDDNTIIATTLGNPTVFTRYKGFTVEPFAARSRGTLRLTGTDGDDDARLELLSNESGLTFVASLNGYEQSFNASEIKRVMIDVRDGDDVVAVGANIPVPSDVRGGNGNDQISGGGGTDRLSGGAGDDTFFARDTLPDIISGGAGSDSAQLDDLLDRRSSLETLLV